MKEDVEDVIANIFNSGNTCAFRRAEPPAGIRAGQAAILHEKHARAGIILQAWLPQCRYSQGVFEKAADSAVDIANPLSRMIICLAFVNVVSVT